MRKCKLLIDKQAVRVGQTCNLSVKTIVVIGAEDDAAED